MPSSDSQAFLREFIRSDDTPVVGNTRRSACESTLRRALIEADLVETAMRECARLKTEGTLQVASGARDNMVALPGQLFTNTQIPACIWFLTKSKHVGSGRDDSNLELAIAA